MTGWGADWLTPQGWQRGAPAGGTAASPRWTPRPSRRTRPAAGPFARLAGFIDTHVHGGGAATHGGPRGWTCSRVCMCRHGTTALLATTMTGAGGRRSKPPHCAPLRRPLRSAGRARRAYWRLLEGPYLNPERLGAQPGPHRAHAALAEVQRLHALAPIRVLTLAPRAAGPPGLDRARCATGIRVQIGQQCHYDGGCAALAAGLLGFTHLSTR